MNGVDAVVRTSRELELELVRQCWTVHLVQKLVDQCAMRTHLVVAGLFAARVPDATHRAAERRAGAAQIKTDLVELVERFLGALGRDALAHDVAGLAVQRAS